MQIRRIAFHQVSGAELQKGGIFFVNNSKLTLFQLESSQKPSNAVYN